MCINNTGNGGGDHGGSRQNSKQVKHQKVPQRGLGVAQLEKILREQENKGKMIENTETQGLSKWSSPSVFNHQLPPRPVAVTPPLCAPLHRPVAVKPPLSAPPPRPVAVTPPLSAPPPPHSSMELSFPPSNVINIQNQMAQNVGPMVGLPETAFGKGIWTPQDFPNASNSKSMAQMKHFEYPSKVTASLAGIHGNFEPPSSQRGYHQHHIQSIGQEQGKMAGTKRPHAYFGNEQNNNNKNPTLPQHKPEWSFFNYGTPTMTMPSQIPQAVQFHKIEKLPVQENMVETQQRSEPNGFVQKNNVNGFVSEKEEIDNEESDEGKDGIDLTLKL